MNFSNLYTHIGHGTVVEALALEYRWTEVTTVIPLSNLANLALTAILTSTPLDVTTQCFSVKKSIKTVFTAE